MHHYSLTIVTLLLFFSCSEKNATESVNNPSQHSFQLESQSLVDGQTIPKKHICKLLEGENISPQFYWINPPENVISYSLLMDDEILNGPTYVHWQVFNIPKTQSMLNENFIKSSGSSIVMGRNYNNLTTYQGPCPSTFDESTHIYTFTLYALNINLSGLTNETMMTRKEFSNSFKNNILASSNITVQFSSN